jgi:hypothetical protein
MVVDKTVISTLEPSCKDVLWVKPSSTGDNKLLFYDGGWKEVTDKLEQNVLDMQVYPEAKIKAGCINIADIQDKAGTYIVTLPEATKGVPCSFIISSQIMGGINTQILNDKITRPIFYDKNYKWNTLEEEPTSTSTFLIEGYFDGEKWFISSKEYQLDE